MPMKSLTPRSVNLDIFRMRTFFAFETKLLEIEAEDNIRFFTLCSSIFNAEEICKRKILVTA